VHALDPRFRSIMINNARIKRIYTGWHWGEGPLWFGNMRCL
jgi:gluconolactonase